MEGTDLWKLKRRVDPSVRDLCRNVFPNLHFVLHSSQRYKQKFVGREAVNQKLPFRIFCENSADELCLICVECALFEATRMTRLNRVRLYYEKRTWKWNYHGPIQCYRPMLWTAIIVRSNFLHLSCKNWQNCWKNHKIFLKKLSTFSEKSQEKLKTFQENFKIFLRNSADFYLKI